MQKLNEYFLVYLKVTEYVKVMETALNISCKCCKIKQKKYKTLPEINKKFWIDDRILNVYKNYNDMMRIRNKVQPKFYLLN